MMTTIEQPAVARDAGARRTICAMGTEVTFVLDRDPSRVTDTAFDEARRELERLARIFTRFDAGSELRRLNRSTVMRCSPELVEVLGLALHARDTSAGRFDPFILEALVALGYDRTFADVSRLPRASGRARPTNGAVDIDLRTRVVRREHGQLDLGGIAKGWIADRLATQLSRCAPALVDAGGDIACTRRGDGEPWQVAVAGTDLQLGIDAGAVATSGVDRRTWVDPATHERRSHVVDPATGASASTDLVTATCVASSCAVAEAAATSVLIAGSARVATVATSFDVFAIALTRDGAVIRSDGGVQ